MNDEFQKRIDAAIANPQNMGEMDGADAIGTVGNADCGDMLRVWVNLSAAKLQKRPCACGVKSSRRTWDHCPRPRFIAPNWSKAPFVPRLILRHPQMCPRLARFRNLHKRPPVTSTKVSTNRSPAAFASCSSNSKVSKVSSD